MEGFAAWNSWKDSVLKKSQVVLGKPAAKDRRPRNTAARLRIRLPGVDGKTVPGTGPDVQIVGSREWEALQGRLAIV
jgi:dynactin 1